MARRVLSAEGRRHGLVWGHDLHRTAKCKVVVHGSDVGIYKAVEHGAAFFTRLSTCGSVWACPVCAPKVQEKRRPELARAVDWAFNGGGPRNPELARAQPVMVTLTFPHSRRQSIGWLLDAQAKALAIMRQGAPWRRFVKRSGYDALIRSLEVTHGRNGWHCHTHEMWFLSPFVVADEVMRQTISRLWASACVRAGLLAADKEEAFAEHAVDIKPWCSASDYLAKMDDAKNWGVDREMAKASSKKGRAKGQHPFGLLQLAIDGDEQAGRLFVEYAEAMTIRRKRQLLWSPGLKKKVGVGEKSDEKLAEEATEKADWLGSLDLHDWRRVLRSEQRAEVLNAAETGGWPAVQALLDALPELLQLPGGAVPEVVARVSDRPIRRRIDRPSGGAAQVASLAAPLQREDGNGGEGDDTEAGKPKNAERDEFVRADCQGEVVNGADSGSGLLYGRHGNGNGCVLHVPFDG